MGKNKKRKNVKNMKNVRNTRNSKTQRASGQAMPERKASYKKRAKKKSGISKAIILCLSLVLLFVVTVYGTKYYLYDSDHAVKKTDLTGVSIDNITLGMNFSSVDISKYTKIEEQNEECNENFEEISFKTNSNGEIEYIIANYKKVNLYIDGKIVSGKINEIFTRLGKNYITEQYRPEENNYWKIAKYSDTDNDIYIGIIYSRYNNEIAKIILSDKKIKK